MRVPTKLASCLFSVGALIGPAITPAAAQAETTQCAPITIDDQSLACVSLSTTVVDRPNGDKVVTATLTVQLAGQSPVIIPEEVTVPVSTVPVPCVATAQRVYAPGDWPITSWSYPPSGREFGLGFRNASAAECVGMYGAFIQSVGPAPTVTPPSVSTTPVQPVSQPYHIPKICVTAPVAECAGPFDGVIAPSIPVPAIASPSVQSYGASRVCFTSGEGAWFTWEAPDSKGSWGFGYYDDGLGGDGNATCSPWVPYASPTDALP